MIQTNQTKKQQMTTPLPPQSSPDDTTNWDNRPFTAPDGKVHIEADKPDPKTSPDIHKSTQD